VGCTVGSEASLLVGRGIESPLESRRRAAWGHTVAHTDMGSRGKGRGVDSVEGEGGRGRGACVCGIVGMFGYLAPLCRQSVLCAPIGPIHSGPQTAGLGRE
jgi:hypothetical protein